MLEEVKRTVDLGGLWLIVEIVVEEVLPSVYNIDNMRIISGYMVLISGVNTC